MSTHRTAVYAGSFDPLTFGHEDMINRAAKMYDTLYIALGVNSSKKPLFTDKERIEMIQDATERLKNVKIVQFDGLLVTFVRSVKSTVLVRGLRAVTDFEYELGLAHANATQELDIETVFLPTRPEYSFIASSVVKEIARHGGNVRRYVNPHVEHLLREKFKVSVQG